MKKILAVIITFLMLLSNIKALDKIYYYDNGIYIYNEENQECEFEYKDLEEFVPISVTNVDIKYLLISEEEIEQNNLDLDNLIIRSRCKINDEFSEWSEEKITKFDYENIPVPEISDFNLDNGIQLNIKNKNEIEQFFEKYSKIFLKDIEYITEYSVDGKDWNKKIDEYNLVDFKLEVRLKYKIGKYESNYSNILTYEKHPAVNTCLFGNDFCCQKILEVSICIWIFIIFMILILFFIILDKKRKREREA